MAYYSVESPSELQFPPHHQSVSTPLGPEVVYSFYFSNSTTALNCICCYMNWSFFSNEKFLLLSCLTHRKYPSLKSHLSCNNIGYFSQLPQCMWGKGATKEQWQMKGLRNAVKTLSWRTVRCPCLLVISNHKLGGSSMLLHLRLELTLSLHMATGAGRMKCQASYDGTCLLSPVL